MFLIKNVIQSSKATKNLVYIHVYRTEILPPFGRLNDNTFNTYLFIPFLFPNKQSVDPYEPSDLA